MSQHSRRNFLFSITSAAAAVNLARAESIGAGVSIRPGGGQPQPGAQAEGTHEERVERELARRAELERKKLESKARSANAVYGPVMIVTYNDGASGQTRRFDVPIADMTAAKKLGADIQQHLQAGAPDVTKVGVALYDPKTKTSTPVTPQLPKLEAPTGDAVVIESINALGFNPRSPYAATIPGRTVSVYVSNNPDELLNGIGSQGMPGVRTVAGFDAATQVDTKAGGATTIARSGSTVAYSLV